MIKVLLADDHSIFLDGLKMLLNAQPRIKVVASLTNGKEVLTALKTCQPDVAVLDIRMEPMDGIETAKYIRKNYPQIKILMLTMHNQKSLILNLMKIGVKGYILKENSKEELVQAIRIVDDGGSYFSLKVMDEVVNGEDEAPQQDIELTDREMEILKLIASEGLTAREIGNRLYISTNTVNTHRRNLLHKVGVKKDTQLVIFAYENKIVSKSKL